MGTTEDGAGSPLTMVGWRETVSLPAWGIGRLRAKIDTGARTSALHVENIEPCGEDRVRFEVVIREGDPRSTVKVEARLVRRSRVKPSSGELQERFVCRTPMVLGPHRREIEVSLVSRSGMLCRMLVGRSALAGLYCVDPSEKHLHSRRRRS